MQLDLERIAAHTGLPAEEVIRLHLETEYTVYAIGFCPGFPYLGYLPPALSGHNQYFLWGPRGGDVQNIIDVGGDCGAGANLFEHVERAAVFSSPLAMPYEDQLPIMLCRGIRRPLAELWPALKLYL